MENKRILAMTGVIYMVIIVLLMTYWMATMTFLRGIAGIMLFPAFGCLSALYWNQLWRVRHLEDQRGRPAVLAVCGTIFAIACVFCLVWGIGQVIAAL